MGVLGIAGHSARNLERELAWIENEVGDKPYGVDLLLPASFVHDWLELDLQSNDKDFVIAYWHQLGTPPASACRGRVKVSK